MMIDQLNLQILIFIELLEKTLANEKEEDIIRNPPKKKIIKQEYKKKQINISKPSKNDKKYTYYTDFLDENGFLNEEKYNKLRGRSYNKNNYIRNCKNDDLNKEKVFKTENYENELNKNEKKNNDINDKNFSSEKKKGFNEQKKKLNEQLKYNNHPEIDKNTKVNIEQKINELNTEFPEFKEDKSKIEKLNNEYSKIQSKLNYDLEDKKLINSLKTQNERLIQNTKKDKETIENLKNQIYQLQLEMRIKENENKITIGKLKKQIEELQFNQNNNNNKYISEHNSTNNILKNSQKLKNK